MSDRKPAEPRSPWQLAWLRLRTNRMAVLGLYLLAAMYVGAIFAGPLAPYAYDDAVHHLTFHPPMLTRLRIFDENGQLSRPFIYSIRVLSGELKTYSEDRTVKFPIKLFVRGDEYRILWVIKSDIHLFGVDQPARIFLFGADQFGRDQLSRLLYGAQISLSIGVLGVAISTVIGMLVGGASGYFGGSLDFVLMRCVEVLIGVPSLYFILLLRHMFSAHASSLEIYLIVVIIISFIASAAQARIIRGMVLSIKEQQFVLAARALGLRNGRIILRHILPNTLSFVMVTATLSIPFYILSEVALSYLGVGIQEPEASWGNMLTSAQNSGNFISFPWMLLPGIFIFVVVMAWNFVGDGLRDAADPRTRLT